MGAPQLLQSILMDFVFRSACLLVNFNFLFSTYRNFSSLQFLVESFNSSYKQRVWRLLLSSPTFRFCVFFQLITDMSFDANTSAAVTFSNSQFFSTSFTFSRYLPRFSTLSFEIKEFSSVVLYISLRCVL